MSELRLKNTYSKALETFRPNDPTGRTVTMYTCGPTVYSDAHVGNFRSFLLGDVLRRVLERWGYVVRQVMNITDVGHMTEDHLADASGEDKLAKAARELGSDPYKVAEHFERLFVEDAKTLRLQNYVGPDADDAALHPRATRHVPEMLVMIQALLDRGSAYLDPRGQVYFEVSKFPEYGALSGKIIDDLESGSRVAVREEKRDPRDFALWKVDEKHLMQWDPHGPAGWPAGDYERFRALAPGGVDKGIRAGFPGWHVECSAMARAHLGATIDIHTGGEDNIFPHHECEIAQSYGAHGDCTPGPDGAGRKSFARFWVHGRHLLVDGRKMSKRDGTFFTARDLLDPRASGRLDVAERLEAAEFVGGRVPPAVLRYALICNPYLQPMNFGFDLLAQAKASVERVQSRYERLRETVGAVTDATGNDVAVEAVERHVREFDAALDDNLNMPNALGALFGLVSDLNQSEVSLPTARAALKALEGFDDVLAILDRRVRSGVLASERIKTAAASGTVVPFAGEAELGELDAPGVERLIVLRHAARGRKDFGQADAIRNNLKNRGVVIEDTPVGVRWKLT